MRLISGSGRTTPITGSQPRSSASTNSRVLGSRAVPWRVVISTDDAPAPLNNAASARRSPSTKGARSASPAAFPAMRSSRPTRTANGGAFSIASQTATTQRPPGGHHAQHLVDRLVAVRKEHEPKLTDRDVERPIRERQRLVPSPPATRHTSAVTTLMPGGRRYSGGGSRPCDRVGGAAWSCAARAQQIRGRPILAYAERTADQ
jgi:hypothetical protein